jgi:hypothetical protein
MNGRNTEFVYESEIEQTVQMLTTEQTGVKEVVQEVQGEYEKTTIDQDRYGNIEHGFLQTDNIVLYVSRNTNGRTIVDDSVQPPKTQRNSYKIHQAAARKDLHVTNVNHGAEDGRDEFSEEAVQKWMNEDGGLERILSGEYADFEDFKRDGDQLIIRIYEPKNIGVTEITLSGFTAE